MNDNNHSETLQMENMNPDTGAAAWSLFRPGCQNFGTGRILPAAIDEHERVQSLRIDRLAGNVGHHHDHDETADQTASAPASSARAIPPSRSSLPSNDSFAPPLYVRRDRFMRRLASVPGYVQRSSTNVHSPTRFSRSRSLGIEQLDVRASKYYKHNSLNFGQIVPFEDKELLEQCSTHSQEQAPEKLDLERGDKDGSDDVLRYKSVHWQDKGEIAKPSNSKAGVASGGKQSSGESRLETIILKQSWATVYKRLFAASFTLNLIGLILATTGHFPYAKSRAALFSVANILMTVLARNEVCLRVFFWLAVHLLGFWWVSVKIKTVVTAFLQSVGGVHSGCGLAAILWLVYALVERLENRESQSAGILGVAWGILFLLVLSCLAAFPVFRHFHHNFFERVHRFAGWGSLGLVWTYILLSAFWDPVTQSYQTYAHRRTELVQMQSLWLTAATTFMIILPWLFVRKVSVATVVPPTKLNSLLNFAGGVQPGLLARISPSPFSEWHAFGIISDGIERHTVLAGAVGDFTKSLVDHPPTHIWVRNFHFAGLPYLTNMDQKALLVATGSGICVFLSFLMQPTRADVHIIWIAKNIRDSYGEDVWEVVKRTPSDRLTVIDTAVSGRPRTKELVVTKAKEWGAEVVIVTSNPSGTNEILSGCKAVGIPAFGPIWDS